MSLLRLSPRPTTSASAAPCGCTPPSWPPMWGTMRSPSWCMMELRRLVRRLRTALHHGGRGAGSEQWSARLVVVANTTGPVGGAPDGGGEPPPSHGGCKRCGRWWEHPPPNVMLCMIACAWHRRGGLLAPHHVAMWWRQGVAPVVDGMAPGPWVVVLTVALQ